MMRVWLLSIWVQGEGRETGSIHGTKGGAIAASGYPVERFEELSDEVLRLELARGRVLQIESWEVQAPLDASLRPTMVVSGIGDVVGFVPEPYVTDTRKPLIGARRRGT